MEFYDLIIIGAGPAGLSLTRELASSNLKILLLDKKNNAEDVPYNTSGSYLNPQNSDLPGDIFHPIERVYFSSKNESFTKNVKGSVINRKKLLAFFEKESVKNKNLKIEYNSTIKEVKLGEAGIDHLVYSGNFPENKVSAKIFADCSGVSSILGRRLGISPARPTLAVGVEYLVPLKKEPQTVDLFVGSNLKGGYGWIAPKDPKTAIIGYGTLDEALFGDVEKNLIKMWDIKRVSDRCDLKPLEKKVAVLRTGKPLEKFSRKNLVIIGDSALQVNPLVGEGIRFIMDAAKIASKWIREAIRKDDLRLLENYGKEWKNKYYKKYKLAHYIQQSAKRDSINDAKMDYRARKMKAISDKDFARLLSGDINYQFLAGLIFKSLAEKWKQILGMNK